MSRANFADLVDRRPDPRAFCRDCYPWPLIVDLSEGDQVTACYLVHERRRGQTRHNKPYLRLSLGDRTGTLEAVIWEDADRWEPLCVPESFVGIRGRTDVYQNKLQLVIELIEPLRVEEADLGLFLPASPRDHAEMTRELDALIASVGDQPLRRLLRRCLGSGSEVGRLFRSHPAARRNHHAYVGGLLEHSLSVARVCDALAQHYNTSGVRVDRDLLVAGALVHDIGKTRELHSGAGFAYTTEGRLLGHIVIGIHLVGRLAEGVADLPEEQLLLLQHLIASHQGRPEWDSPRVPQMLEALLLHYADDLDSKMNPAAALLTDVAAGEWSDYNRQLERAFFRPAPLRLGGEVEEVEAVPVEEATELLIDLFRGPKPSG